MYQDLRQSNEWSLYMKSLGWEVEKVGNVKAYLKKIPILGTVIKIPRHNPPLPLKEIDELAKKHKTLFVKIEPNLYLHLRGGNLDLEKELKIHKFSPDNWSFAPTRTVKINLQTNLDVILSKMEKETRYSIRKAQRENHPTSPTNSAKATLVKRLRGASEKDLEEFIKIYKQTAKRAGFWVGSEKELRLRWEVFSKTGNAELFLISQNKEPLAGAMVFHHDQIAYYYHAASTVEGQKKGFPSLIIWEIIKKAKEKGCHFLDLEGIADSRIPSTKNWVGFSNFKKSLGGEEIIYIGSFSKYYNPLVGSVFKLIQKLGV